MKLEQLDMFDGILFPESIQFKKIIDLEKRQENLRKGIFKRYGEQNKKIDSLYIILNEMLSIIKEKYN
jgi:hypothetical protein